MCVCVYMCARGHAAEFRQHLSLKMLEEFQDLMNFVHSSLSTTAAVELQQEPQTPIW